MNSIPSVVIEDLFFHHGERREHEEFEVIFNLRILDPHVSKEGDIKLNLLMHNNL